MKQFLINSIGKLDLICWMLVIAFFCGSSLIFGGSLPLSFLAALGVVFTMILIGMSIEVIIETLKDIRGLGTITGFITNGPELVCLVVGLAVGDILFAASTPLGSNFMNPILLVIAASVSGVLVKTLTLNPRYTAACLLATASLAIGFYTLPESLYPLWVAAGITITLPLFFRRPAEELHPSGEEEIMGKKMILPATLVLILAGYFLDPMVSFASQQSHAPKGVIGFFVLATLSSWPEFKTCLVLVKRHKYQAAILNITVSNITNIWLAVAGVLAHLSLKGF